MIILSGIFVVLAFYSIKLDLEENDVSVYRVNEKYDEIQHTVLNYSLTLENTDKINYSFWSLYVNNLFVSY